MVPDSGACRISWNVELGLSAAEELLPGLDVNPNCDVDISRGARFAEERTSERTTKDILDIECAEHLDDAQDDVDRAGSSHALVVPKASFASCAP